MTGSTYTRGLGAAVGAGAERSLELEPDNPWAVHALAHEMQGRVDEGTAHLRLVMKPASPLKSRLLDRMGLA